MYTLVVLCIYNSLHSSTREKTLFFDNVILPSLVLHNYYHFIILTRYSIYDKQAKRHSELYTYKNVSCNEPVPAKEIVEKLYMLTDKFNNETFRYHHANTTIANYLY